MSELRDVFLQAMRGVAATVSVVASERDGERIGLVATSVTSLSLEPVSLLVCVNRSSESGAALLRAEIFSVNALSCSQIDIARSFASGGERRRRFDTGHWETAYGAPVLLGAQASFVCRRTRALAYGTHDILVGELLLAKANAEAKPLIYLNGAYTACATELERPHLNRAVEQL
jgi:flavin reductase